MKTKKAKQKSSLVEIKGDNLWTTSLLVAEKFGKRHDNVLQKIEKIRSKNERGLLNFKESSYLNDQGKDQPMYLVDHDGFMFLVLGFTGEEADKWKWEFIDAFNAMRKELERIHIQKSNADWQLARLEGKGTHKETTAAIKAFIHYAIGQGSENAAGHPDKNGKMVGGYFTNFDTLLNKQLFNVKATDFSKPIREILTATQLRHLAIAEAIIVQAIEDGINADLPYHDIYLDAKEKVAKVVLMLGGVSPPGNGSDRQRLTANPDITETQQAQDSQLSLF